jgi:hypothetical protein
MSESESESGTVPASRLISFVAGAEGDWQIVSMTAVRGAALAPAQRLSMRAGPQPGQPVGWVLQGVTSHERYVTRSERTELVARQEGLGRAGATCAALIPLRKSAAWWALTQDERREILEERSQHIRIGLRALPAVARRLHHCRDLGHEAPFDFLTWFEFAPQDAQAFDELVAALRATPEWDYVEREVDLRLLRAG